VNGQLQQAKATAKRTLDGFTSGQRTMVGLALVAAIVGAMMLAKWSGTPQMVPLYSSLEASDASAITDKLASAGEKFELAGGGSTVLVPQDRVYQLRLDMSAADLPSGGSEGYSLLDKQGITTSDFQQQVQYQRALEGELTKTIGAIDGVTAAVVHLAIPRKSVFIDEEQPPTASVLVKTTPGKELTSQQVRAVVHLVSSSIAGMTTSAVTVADTTGRVLSADGVQGGGGAAGDEQTLAYEDRMSTSLQRMVEQVVGPGHSVVRVSAVLDYDQSSRTVESYTAPKSTTVPLSETANRETYTGSGAAVGGVLGPDNNNVPTGTGTGATKYDKTQTTRDNAVDKVVEQVKTAPGSVKRLSVAVMLDSATAGSIDQAKLQEAISKAAGLQPTRGDALSVTDVPFDTTAAKAAETELKAVEATKSREQMMSMAKTGGLVLLAVVVLIVLLRRGRRAGSNQVLTTAEVAELEAARAQLAGRAAVLEGSEQQLALPAAVDIPAQRRAQAQADLGDLVERQPDDVAQLLRGWLSDKGA
jgi:flagellar M-ring protein FliF